MFNSIGWGEIMLLLIVALFIFGPDRLPSMAKEAAGAMQKVRGFVTGARAQIREELGEEFADIDLRSLNPREFVRRQLLDDDPPPLVTRSNGTARGTGARVDTSKPGGNGRVSTSKPATARMGESSPHPATSPDGPPAPAASGTVASSAPAAGSVPVDAAAPPPYDSDAT